MSTITIFRVLVFCLVMSQPSPNPKQLKAYQSLKDPNIDTVFYGGAAGGGKSWLGCEWLMRCGYYLPKTRWFVGRNNLTDTRESVLVTWSKVANAWGFHKYRLGDKGISFKNGSEIVFLDLTFYPKKDPLFERFGSKEFTGGWIEEAGEVHVLAYDVLKSRIGRHMNAEYCLKPKILLTANPKKNWLYTQFYKRWKEQKLESSKAFIQAFYTDNLHLTKDYEKQLQSISDKNTRERLKDGNWEYNDDPTALCAYENIIATFSNDHLKGDKKYITADVARLGSDEAIIAVWDDWILIEVAVFEKSRTTEIQDKINEFRRKYSIPKSHTIADEDGVGGGVVDNCGIVGFVNNAKPFPEKKKTFSNYTNLQSQCGYHLAEQIQNHNLWIKYDLGSIHKERVIEDLEQLKSFNVDNEKKLAILPKKEIKETIGRSPDWRDVLLMRSYFDLAPKRSGFRGRAA